jgi:predicted metal-dependent hydrolase
MKLDTWNKFDFSQAATAWLDNDVYLTHLFNAPSLVFPHVEGFVNYAVYMSMQKMTDKMSCKKYQDFMDEETRHAKEHVRYNKILASHGFCSDAEVNAVKQKLQKIRKKWSLLSILAVAVGFESLTLMLSKVALEENLMAHAEKNMQQFWLWHMQEEVAHKDVLMDLYQQMGGGYFRRIVMLTLVLGNYCYYGTKIYLNLLKIHKVSAVKGLRTMFGRKSFFVKGLILSLQCYGYRYHPAS